MRTKKIYFKLVKEETPEGINYYFKSIRNEIMRFSWKPQFIVKWLVDLYGPEEWEDIYNKFMAALLYSQDKHKVQVQWQDRQPFPLVLYTKYTDVNTSEDRWSDLQKT